MKKQRKKKMFKKSLAAVLTAAMVLSGVQNPGAYASAAEVDSIPTELEAADADQFMRLRSEIREAVSGESGCTNIVITIKGEIDLSKEEPWEPINIDKPSLQLTVVGKDDATIKGLNVVPRSESEPDNVGIFGNLNCNVTFRDITFEEITVSATGKNIGTVAGKLSGNKVEFDNVNVIQPKIENKNNSNTTNVGGVVGYISSPNADLEYVGAYNKYAEVETGEYEGPGESGSVIQGTDCVGGIIGRLDYGMIYLSANYVSVTGTASSKHVGGLVGYLGTDVDNNDRNNTADICKSKNYGNVTGNIYVGGVVGSIGKNGCCGYSTSAVTDNYGTVTGNEIVGGIVGSNAGTIQAEDDDVTVRNFGRVNGGDQGVSIGGICGWNTGSIAMARNRDDVTGDVNVGGIVGNNVGSVDKCISSGIDGNSIEITGNENVGGIIGSNAGSVRKSTNDSKATITGNTCVGGITGINFTEDSKVSECTNNGNVTGVERTEDGKKIPSSNIGGIAGENQGDISKSTNNADVSGDNNVGGIAGINTGNIKEDCVNNGGVTGKENVGGIAGDNKGNISDAKNTGDVTGDKNVGGIAGDNAGSVINSNNGATVKGNENVGGITGINSTEDSKVTGCTNVGEVIGVERTDENGKEIPSNNIGGISGENDGTISSSTNKGDVSGDNNVGGIAGINKGDIKDNCVNEGDVTGKENVGGIAGDNQGNISDATNEGNVKGDKNVGGIAGENEGNISNSTNNGDVTGKENVGGLAGENTGNISNSTNNGNVTGEDEETTGGLAGVNKSPDGTNDNITGSTNNGTVNGEPASGDNSIGKTEQKDPEPSVTPSQTPGATPSQTPGATPSQEPGTTPSQEPGTNPSQKPGTTPSQEPGTNPSQEPGTNPSQEPGTSPSQAPDASTSPSQAPNASTSPNPSATPGVSAAPNASATPNPNAQYGTPSYNTGGTNVINYITNPTSATWDKEVRFGYIFTVGNYTYRITKSTLIGDSVNTVELYRVANRSLKTISINNQVKLGTQSFNIVAIRNDVAKKYSSVTKVVIGDKVTKIGSRAFMGCKKLKSVNIDSKKLTKIGTNAFSGCKKLNKVVIVSSRVKSVGKNAFKNTAKKLVLDVPNKKAKAYKKVFAKSGKAKKAVIK